jgi:hypothetical protein
MTDAEYRRSLLQTRIDAHRDLLRLELRLARRQFDPWRAGFSLLGVDSAVAGTVGASLRGLVDSHEGLLLSGAIVPVLVAALLPLVDRFLRGGDVARRDGDDVTAGPRSG